MCNHARSRSMEPTCWKKKERSDSLKLSSVLLTAQVNTQILDITKKHKNTSKRNGENQEKSMYVN